MIFCIAKHASVCIKTLALSDTVTFPIFPTVALDTSLVVVSSKPAAVGLVTYKVKVPKEHWMNLEVLSKNSMIAVKRMLENRKNNSSKFYKEVPCVVSKSLITKYQNDTKCKKVSRLSIPICGDKGKQVKLVSGGIRIPAIFKKNVIPSCFPLPIVGFVRHVELFKRSGEWFMSYSYNTSCAKPINPTGVVGVDRNSVGNIATIACSSTGIVRSMGFSADHWKSNFKRRMARIMSNGRKRLAARLRRKQSRRTKYENHRIAKGIVDFAARQNCALSLENLKLTKGAKDYAKKQQWSHAQLFQFIQYKAALRGVPMVLVDPAYTSQDCSRCGQRNKPVGKKYVCSHCNSKSHRDTNAAFNIAIKGALAWTGAKQESSRRAFLVKPCLGS